MYLVVIAWLYVALMMAVAEATSTTGTVLGALVTFVLYGLAPLSLVMYLLGTPARRKARRAREAAEQRAAEDAHAGARSQAGAGAAPASGEPDAGGHAPGAAEPGGVAPVRKEP